MKPFWVQAAAGALVGAVVAGLAFLPGRLLQPAPSARVLALPGTVAQPPVRVAVRPPRPHREARREEAPVRQVVPVQQLAVVLTPVHLTPVHRAPVRKAATPRVHPKARTDASHIVREPLHHAQAPKPRPKHKPKPAPPTPAPARATTPGAVAGATATIAQPLVVTPQQAAPTTTTTSAPPPPAAVVPTPDDQGHDHGHDGGHGHGHGHDH